MSDHPEHEPQPAPAEEGYLCKRDANRLYKWLGAVLDDTLRLDVRIPVDYRWEKESNHQKVTGSPALVRLGVAALTDGRNPTNIVTEFAEEYPENGDDQAIPSIPQKLCSWAVMFTEEQNIESPVDTMFRAVEVLTNWWETLVAQLWIDAFYNDMAEIRLALDLAHEVERPKPMGQCFTCEAALYSRPGCTDIMCGQCGRRYDGLSLVKLEIQRRREATA
jgi:hypothetical protein